MANRQHFRKKPLNAFITSAGVTLIALMLLALLRAIKGPTVIDRLVAINVIGTKSIVLFLFAGILFGVPGLDWNDRQKRR